MSLFKCEREIPSVGKNAETDLTERVPDALLVLVLDKEGNITPLRVRETDIARERTDDDFPLTGTTITEFDSIALLGTRGSTCKWVKLNGRIVQVCSN